MVRNIKYFRKNTVPTIIKATPQEKREAFNWIREHKNDIQKISQVTHSEPELHINMSNKRMDNTVAYKGEPKAIKKKKDYKGQRLYIELNNAKTPEAVERIRGKIREHFASLKLIAGK